MQASPLKLNVVELVILFTFTVLQASFYYAFPLQHVNKNLYYIMCGFMATALPLYRWGRPPAWVALIVSCMITALARKHNGDDYSALSILTETQAFVGGFIVLGELVWNCCVTCDRRITWMDG